MKRVLGVAVVLMLPATFLVGCGGDDDAADSTTTTSKSSEQKPDSDSSSSDSSDSSDSSSSSDSGSSTGNEKVDKFCDDAKALAEKSKKAIADNDTDLAKEAAKDAQELSSQAMDLTAEVMKDPSLASALTDCTKELSDIGSS